jgi:hypothetical protein
MSPSGWISGASRPRVARDEVALATGQGNLAETAARRALASVDAETFARNHTSYATHLGLVLIRRGQLDEAIAITGNAV